MCPVTTNFCGIFLESIDESKLTVLLIFITSDDLIRFLTVKFHFYYTFNGFAVT